MTTESSPPLTPPLHPKTNLPTTDHLQHPFAHKILHESFVSRYGHPPEFYAQAPGRVNLIGEHIDYAGYGVFPMAISRTVVLAISSTSPSVDDQDGDEDATDYVQVRHVNQGRFPDGRFPIDPSTAIVEVDDETGNGWIRYVQCGYRGAWDVPSSSLSLPTPPSDNDDEPTNNGRRRSPRALSILVWGDIPLAAGLSSSSALVTASLLGSLHSRSLVYTSTLAALALIAARAESRIGTLGGGMDHTASLLGYARSVSFYPTLAATSAVDLPPGVVFVIADTGISAEKADERSAKAKFNRRVVESELAAKVLAARLGLSDPVSFRNLRMVHEEVVETVRNDVGEDRIGRQLGVRGLGTMVELVQEHLKPGGYTEEDVGEALRPYPSSAWFRESGDEERGRIEEVLQQQSAGGSDQLYMLRERALHVYKEAERVEAFEQVCRNGCCSGEGERGVRVELGRLMDASHESCSGLYDCSCEELDGLVKASRESGAEGSRLTGAGWGGCTVSLVVQDRAEQLIEGLKKTYYEKEVESGADLSKICFPAVAIQGACLFSPSNKIKRYEPVLI